MKKRTKYILLAIAGIFIYEIGGMLAPFMKAKEVSEEYKESVDVPSFYSAGQTAGTDRAAVVEGNQEALDMRLSMFEEAKESIELTTFDIRPGKSTEDIFSSLLAAADRGVKVRLIVDGMYGMLHMRRDPMFYAAGTHENIEIQYYNEPNLLMPWTINGRMHDKYILVDDKLLLMGGRNMFDYFLGEYKGKSTGYDREVLIYHAATEEKEADTAINQVRTYFNEMWDSDECRRVFEDMPPNWIQQTEIAAQELRSHYQELTPERQDYESVTVPIEKATFVHNPTHIYGKEPYVWEQLRQLMMQADERVLVHTPYAVFSDDMYDGMREIAEEVPDAGILLNSIAAGDNICASTDYRTHKQEIVDTGMQIYEYMGKHSMHGKSVLIDDDISVIGSYNFDNRSTYVDTETMLVIHSEELNAQLEENLNVLKEQSLEVDQNGNYVENPNVEEKQISEKKEWMMQFLSFWMRIGRNLV